MVIPRRFSSGRRSVSMPVSALTSAVFPWSMWPAVPTTRFLRSIRLRNVPAGGNWRVAGGGWAHPLPATCHPLAVGFFELRRQLCLLAERFLQIAGVHDGLTPKMIVGNDVCFFLLGHALDAIDPVPELLFRVKVVVSLPRFFVREPLIVVASMQPRVGDRTGHGVGWLDRFVEERLIDVDPGHVSLFQKAEELVILN